MTTTNAAAATTDAAAAAARGTAVTGRVAETGGVFTVTDTAVARWRQARSLVFLALLTFAMLRADPRPAPAGRGLAVIALVAVAGVAWLAMTLRDGQQPRAAAIAVCGAAGLALCALDTRGYAPCYLIAAGTVAVAALPVAVAAAGTALAAAGLTAVLWARGAGWTEPLVWAGSLALVTLLGVVRRQRDEQARQARTVAALDERARLAREIHDVLAHSLSALSVQLETAAALLEKDRAADAAVLVERAGRLARDGLTETRRAVGALRGDPVPLGELVGALADGYRADLGAPADVTVSGTPRPLDAEPGLALFRTAQEALTNVRKHAPGSAVSVHVGYGGAAVRLTVRNSAPATPDAAPPGGHGTRGTPPPGGHGLAGLRERVALAGGTFSAAPDGDGWLVDARIPG
ncbi:sensor histidine kinase [Dactylosporangium aurantiacum]|uniref:histidine kinase n=1 Tax=Dactylosporangium aurantiacum TaxID=35754 RepID=A0A9Q9IB89_9ACTN|nr:sensor histidine kinase [Dactylosporangium aurantiacum]MDG6101591.1 sensor histidine kinase [Dactylosporangium aurantiacum]UWZ52576.1 sensor histidine kinase [Dactylosporangium aurantiacum]